jgi:hypothetical protein
MFSHVKGFLHHSILMWIMQNLKQQYFIISNVFRMLFLSMSSHVRPFGIIP